MVFKIETNKQTKQKQRKKPPPPKKKKRKNRGQQVVGLGLDTSVRQNKTKNKQTKT